MIVFLCNGHLYADVIPIYRSINVLWIKTISISKVTKYCAALSNAKLNRKWRPLKCIFHNPMILNLFLFLDFFFNFIQNAISGETFDFRILTSIWLVIKTIKILETKRTLLGFILATPRDHSACHTMLLFLSLPEPLTCYHFRTMLILSLLNECSTFFLIDLRWNFTLNKIKDFITSIGRSMEWFISTKLRIVRELKFESTEKKWQLWSVLQMIFFK